MVLVKGVRGIIYPSIRGSGFSREMRDARIHIKRDDQNRSVPGLLSWGPMAEVLTLGRSKGGVATVYRMIRY